MSGFSVTTVVVFDRSLEVAGAMEARMDQVSDEGANRVADRASANAPKLTGTMAGDFTVEGSGTERQVSNTAPYFPYVELGTRKMAAEPSLGPAAREEARSFRDDVVKAVEEVTAL